MSTFFTNLESFGAKTQKLWPKNRSAYKVWCKIGHVFLAITPKDMGQFKDESLTTPWQNIGIEFNEELQTSFLT